MRSTEPVIQQVFAGKLAVITGSAQGIGRAIAEDLLARGAQLVLVDRNGPVVSATAASLRRAGGPSVDVVIADLSDPRNIQEIAAAVASIGPSVDVLVNNAAIELDLPFGEVTASLFDQVLGINLRAPLLLSQALLPLFPLTGGTIVNISSIHSSHAFPNSIPYACSKAGLIALTRNLALELAERHIRVNAVCPGYIDTPMWDEYLRSVSDAEAVARETEALHPLGRRGLPQDVASAVAYLAGPQSAWVTGTHLVVDGGLTIRAHP
jgi:NAD(P)-dependent dehydrogenase (short-subunit alcohol dehydrogenase family)